MAFLYIYFFTDYGGGGGKQTVCKFSLNKIFLPSDNKVVADDNQN